MDDRIASTYEVYKRTTELAIEGYMQEIAELTAANVNLETENTDLRGENSALRELLRLTLDVAHDSHKREERYKARLAELVAAVRTYRQAA